MRLQHLTIKISHYYDGESESTCSEESEDSDSEETQYGSDYEEIVTDDEDEDEDNDEDPKVSER